MAVTAWVSLETGKNGTRGATIHYSLAADSNVKIEMFDVIGRKVCTLLPGERQTAGWYEIFWDGTCREGNKLDDGSYLYRLSTEE